jgi:3',5'-cyclic AMP phosphodiesterase CpdA
MLLLHISDIHFRAPDCLNPDLDPDRPYRTRMVQDAHARTQTLGPVGAILVGGDIAFKSDPQEYQAAFAWLEELAAACGCPSGACSSSRATTTWTAA